MVHILEILDFRKQPLVDFIQKSHPESLTIAVVIARLSKIKQKVE